MQTVIALQPYSQTSRHLVLRSMGREPQESTHCLSTKHGELRSGTTEYVTNTGNSLSTTVDGKATIAALNSLSSEVDAKADGSELSSLQSDVTELTTTVNGKASTSCSLCTYLVYNNKCRSNQNHYVDNYRQR